MLNIFYYNILLLRIKENQQLKHKNKREVVISETKVIMMQIRMNSNIVLKMDYTLQAGVIEWKLRVSWSYRTSVAVYVLILL